MARYFLVECNAFSLKTIMNSTIYNHRFPLILFSVINIILLLSSFTHSAEMRILLCCVQHTARINNIIVDATLV